MCACGFDKRPGWLRCCESLRLVYLYEVTLESTNFDKCDYDAKTLVVAKNEQDAEEKAKQKYRGYLRYIARRVDMVDGYRVKVDKS